ncbi:MAG: hypothetical protein AB7G93_22155 [Bdellovibrionales bacterium]
MKTAQEMNNLLALDLQCVQPNLMFIPQLGGFAERRSRMNPIKTIRFIRGFTALMLLAGLTWTASSYAAYTGPGRCTLKVDGRTYINGRCDINLDDQGNFYIGQGDYFAYVYPSDDTRGAAYGYWNGVEGASHAHTDLGALLREGPKSACWSNARARVCAWR